MMSQTALNVPHKQGKASVLIAELTDMMGGCLGCDKFCMILNLLGWPGLGITEMGDIWKGPNSASTCSQDRGPKYLL